jgi:hypothetical protein
MKLVSTLALSAALVAGGIAAAPAAAQSKKNKKEAAAAAQAQPAERKFNISKAAGKPISELQAAVRAKTPDAPQKLAAAQAVATTTDDKYVVAKLQLDLAIAANDKAAQLAAIDAILASGGAEAVEISTLNNYKSGQALLAGDYARAETLLTAHLATAPNDLDAVINLSRTKLELKKDAEALPLLQRAIALNKAAGKKGEEAWYRKALEIAHNQKNTALAAELGRETLNLYPSTQNFKNLVAITQPLLARDEEASADLLRLLQVSGNLTSSTDYLRLAQYYEYNRNWGAAKTVVDAAAAAGKTSGAHSALLSRVSGKIAEDKAALPGAEAKARSGANGSLALSLASVYSGYGDYAKAVDLYRVALQKGGVDANVVNTRLGMTLAMAGQRAEAEAAFGKVTGSRAPLAGLWMAWLAQRG